MTLEQSTEFIRSGADQVIYRFQDSSVPPRYHRSYSIVITAETITVTVDCYGDILAQQNIASSVEQFQAVLALLDQANIHVGETEPTRAMPGGRSDRISTSCQGRLRFDGYHYRGGGDANPLQGDVAAVKAHLRQLIPNFSDLLRASN